MANQNAIVTLIIDAKNLASAQLKALQRDLRGAEDGTARMNAAMGRGAMVAKGALALGFAAAARGAGQLADVQADLQAQTGASADEAHAMAQAVNGIAGATRQSLPVVSAAMAKVRSDLGLTGEAANAVTAAFVDYARVTGQDASAAVATFDNILDSWGLQASDAAGLMDKLVVSHQRYGGSVAANSAALASLAPQLRAMNLSVDDGIGLLNLFETTGMDATGATRALTTAITKLQPGQSLQDLIDQIGSIEDPTQRAKAAIELFGARGGANLANVLRPGTKALDDYGVSAADAAGAVDRAASAIDSTFPAMVSRAMSEAGAAVRGFGDAFGPALMSAMSATSLWQSVGGALDVSLTGALKGAWTRAATSPVVMAAAAAAGRAAALAAAAGALAVPVVIAVKLVADRLDTGTSELADARAQYKAEFASIGIDAAVAMREAVSKKLNGAPWEMAPLAQRANWAGFLAQLDTDIAWAAGTVRDTWWREMEAAGTAGATAISQGFDTGRPGMLRTMVATVGDVVRDAKVSFKRYSHSAGVAAAKTLAQGITDARNEPYDAWVLLGEMLKHPMSVSQERARLWGQLHGKRLADGLKSKDPAVRAQAEYTRDLIRDRLKELAPKAKTDGAAIGNNLADGLTSTKPAIATAAGGLGDVISDYLRVRSPARRGPLSKDGGPEGFGRRFGRLYGAGLQSAVGAISAAATVTAGVTVSASGAGLLRPAAAPAAAGGARGTSVHLHVHSAYPPTRAQIGEWADQLDAEFARRRSTYPRAGR